jgi:pSer/pThr/pTyr-binding forkhead associated (FHA) protein
MPYFEVQLTKKLHRIYDIAPNTTIGRAPQCEVQLLSRAVSRRHARMEFGDGGEAIISDLGTKNGIKLNGQRVQGAAIVQEGDRVVVGDIHMTFRTADRTAVPANVIDLRTRAPGPPDVAYATQHAQASFLIPAHPDAISMFQTTVARSRIEALDFDDLTRFKLQIALKEAVENARVHGSASDPSRGILITFTEVDEEFTMSIKDEGAGYEAEGLIATLDEVDALEAIRNRQPARGKLGLRIILNCVDRLQLEGRGSTIHMGRFKDAGQLFVISEDESGLGALPEDSTIDDGSSDLEGALPTGLWGDTAPGYTGGGSTEAGGTEPLPLPPGTPMPGMTPLEADFAYGDIPGGDMESLGSDSDIAGLEPLEPLPSGDALPGFDPNSKVDPFGDSGSSEEGPISLDDLL